ncbi:MAG TPA: hypothetical protein VGE92_14015 [Steroidobacteraceae bacterium]
MTGSVYRSLGLWLTAICLPAFTEAENLDGALRHCATESDLVQRLACFDAIVSTLPQVEADRFGMTAEIEHKRDPQAVPQAKDEVLSGKISGLRQASQDQLIFTLDNGQVWIQTETRPNVQFALSEDVHIEHGSMSSLWLVADKHRKVRVKRLR